MIFSLCARTANTCQSKRNCLRHEHERSLELNEAPLNLRREAGATACGLVMWIEPPCSTFSEVAE